MVVTGLIRLLLIASFAWCGELLRFDDELLIAVVDGDLLALLLLLLLLLATAAPSGFFFWYFFIQKVEQKFGFGAFARITLSHWIQAPLLYAFRNSEMQVSEQNSFLPFCVGSTYLSGAFPSPHQVQLMVGVVVVESLLLLLLIAVELFAPELVADASFREGRPTLRAFPF